MDGPIKKPNGQVISENSEMTEYEIISIEPTSVGKYWVLTYKTADGKIDKEMVEGLDPHEASIAFRNLVMKQAKLQALKKPKNKLL